MAKAKSKMNRGRPAKRKTAAKRKTSAKRKGTAKRKTTSRRKTASRRTLVAPRGNKRFVRRSASGQFDEVDDVGRSLSNDRKSKSRTKAKRGQGDRGDR